MKIPDNIRAVIFDFDGVIIDSEPTWRKTHNEFFKKYKIAVNEEEIKGLQGIGLKQLVTDLHKEFNLKKSVNELLSEYHEIFYKIFSNSKKMELIIGVEKVVRYLFEKGYKLAIATGGHTEKEIEKMLSFFNLLKYFEVVVSGDDVKKGKPHPDVFLVAAKRLEVSPEKCLVIEDSVNGVKAGKAAGMLVYGVNRDDKIYNDLKEADEVFHSIEEL